MLTVTCCSRTQSETPRNSWPSSVSHSHKSPGRPSAIQVTPHLPAGPALTRRRWDPGTHSPASASDVPSFYKTEHALLCFSPPTSGLPVILSHLKAGGGRPAGTSPRVLTLAFLRPAPRFLHISKGQLKACSYSLAGQSY